MTCCTDCTYWNLKPHQSARYHFRLADHHASLAEMFANRAAAAVKKSTRALWVALAALVVVLVLMLASLLIAPAPAQAAGLKPFVTQPVFIAPAPAQAAVERTTARRGGIDLPVPWAPRHKHFPAVIRRR